MALPKYKRSRRDTRRIIQDGNFKKGMFYTSNIVDDQTSKLILNYNIRDNGGHLSPRMGLDMVANRKTHTKNTPYSSTNFVPGVHAKFFGMYKDIDGLDRFGTIVLSFGVPSHPEYRYYLTDEEKLSATYKDMVYTNASGLAFGVITDENGKSHDIDMSKVESTRLRFYKNTPKPLFTIFKNKLYTINGAAGHVTGTETFTQTGIFSRTTPLSNNGIMTSLEVVPLTSDVEPFTMYTYAANSSRSGTVVLRNPLRLLKSNGAADKYSLSAKAIIKSVELIPFRTIMDNVGTVTEGLEVSIYQIPKPADFFAKGKVSSNVFRTSEFGMFEELDISDSAVLDKAENLWKYSCRTNADFIELVVPKGMLASEANEALYSQNFKYFLNTPVHIPVDHADTLQILKDGSIVFDTTPGYFPIRATYSITYTQDVFDYQGGLQEYKFFRDATGFHAVPTPIVAKVPIISEATSVGFNMLHPNPYGFQNKEGIVLRPMGIMPYKPGSAQSISMSANVGEDITFETIYEYRKGEKYFSKWEYMPLSFVQTLDPVLLQDFQKTPFDAGTKVTLTTKANDAKFTLRCTMCPPKPDGTPDDLLAKVIVYPVYEAGNAYLKDISTFKYNLHNAKGIGSYKTMLCLWGVPGAETTLFFSDIDDTSYFPFANNIVSFNDKILGTQNYQGGLLVFTTDSIYLIQGFVTAKFDVTELYQNLKFTAEDLESLEVIKNVIFIRSGKNYYSLSPNSYTGEISDIRLTSLSAPIKEIISDWRKFLQFLGEEVFHWDLTWNKDTIVKEYDFFNHVDDSAVCNVYRFAIYEQREFELMRYQVDVSMNYDSSKGIWTVQTLNLPYNEVLAAGGKFYTSYSRGDTKKTQYYYQTVEFKNFNRQDEYNTIYYGHAHNDINLTKREIELQKLPAIMLDEVVSVIDGDTVILKDLGSTRLLYIDTPEATTKIEEFGPEATLILKNLIPVGTTVTVEFEGDRSDKYGRVLAWIKTPSGVLVQMHMAEKGAVKSVYAYGAEKYADELDAAIKTAYDNEVGLYAVTRREVKYFYSYKSEDIVPNYQVLDTGNKNHDSYQDKRYRQFQMQLRNKSAKNLSMFSRFYIDSTTRQDFRSFKLTHDNDEMSQNYGTIDVESVDTSTQVAVANTHLGTWEIDRNAFPQLEVVKVNLHISGKGKYPRMLLICKSEADYDLLSYAWVIRAMNFR